MKRRCLLYLFLFSILLPLWSQSGVDILNKQIRIDKQKNTVYELLNYIGDISNLYFIYDSKVVDNERKTKISAGTYTIREAVLQVLQSANYELKVVGKYILVNTKVGQSNQSRPAAVHRIKDIVRYKQISGTILEKITQTPIPYCSVSLEGTGVGTVTNSNGKFLLRVPDTLHIERLHISHIGYEPHRIPIALMENSPMNIYLTPHIVSIQEVIVRLVNPQKIVKEVLEAREMLCFNEPAYFTTFYREGIERKKEFIKLTEAVFKVYKQSYNRPLFSDQVKLLKMRKITNNDIKDTVVLRMKAGVDASLILDLMKNVPDFLEIDDRNVYDYSKIDMTEIDSRMAHVISFEQKKGITEPYYKGKLYIDAQNSALLSAQFEISPKYIEKVADVFVVKKTRNVSVTPQRIVYTVSFREWKGKYYMNHTRGDLYFKTKLKKQLFATPIHIFFEMATCKVDTTNVLPFPKQERILTRQIFSEEKFVYDDNFWGNFNVILPEESINKNLSRITSKIEESE